MAIGPHSTRSSPMIEPRLLLYRLLREAFRRVGPFSCLESFPAPDARKMLIPQLSEEDALLVSKLEYLETVLCIMGSSNLRRFKMLNDRKRTILARSSGLFRSPYDDYERVPHHRSECIAAAKAVFRNAFGSGEWRRIPGKNFETDTPSGRYCVLVDFGSWSSSLDLRMRFRDLDVDLGPTSMFGLQLKGYLSYRDPDEFEDALQRTVSLFKMVPTRLRKLQEALEG
jgi:hypothetical protein